MRISDWSSDVCSSDLLRLPHAGAGLRRGQLRLAGAAVQPVEDHPHRTRRRHGPAGCRRGRNRPARLLAACRRHRRRHADARDAAVKLNLLLVVEIAPAALAASIAVVPRRAEQALMMMRRGNPGDAQALLEENLPDGHLKAGKNRPLVDLYL